jgi:pimeloyl-ACP methyl ester carboxylesterase
VKYILEYSLIGAVGAISVIAAYYLQPIFLYHPRGYESSELSALHREATQAGLEMVQLRYNISTGDQQVSFLIKPRPMSELIFGRLVVFFGGNGMTALDGIQWLLHMHVKVLGDASTTIAFLAVDYPGYGHSKGQPSPNAIQESVEKALVLTLERLDGSITEIDVIGHSLGAAVAARFVASRPTSAMVPVRTLLLSAPFTSISDMASHIFGLLYFWQRSLLAMNGTIEPC